MQRGTEKIEERVRLLRWILQSQLTCMYAQELQSLLFLTKLSLLQEPPPFWGEIMGQGGVILLLCSAGLVLYLFLHSCMICQSSFQLSHCLIVPNRWIQTLQNGSWLFHCHRSLADNRHKTKSLLSAQLCEMRQRSQAIEKLLRRNYLFFNLSHIRDYHMHILSRSHTKRKKKTTKKNILTKHSKKHYV